MEKLSLQEFRKLKKETIDMIIKFKELDDIEKDFPEEEMKKIENRYNEIFDTLSNHDLSDIDFEEWRDMFIGYSSLDFSKTKANLDFSIIDYDIYKVYLNIMYDNYEYYPNFKNCKIKNFDFENYNYFPEMFDEEFIKENQEWFLSEDVPEDIREKYYIRTLKVQEIFNNPQYFKGKKVEHELKNNPIAEKLVLLYGENIFELYSKYKKLLDFLLEQNRKFFIFGSTFRADK